MGRFRLLTGYRGLTIRGRLEAVVNIAEDEIKALVPSLITEVVVSPEAPSWLKGLVERVLERYSLSELAVRQSTLNQLPC